VSVPRELDRPLNLGVDVKPGEAVALVSGCVEFRSLRAQSARRLNELFSRFARYVEHGHGCSSLSDISSAHVRGFIRSPSGSDPSAPPAPATMHLRRSAVRLFFRLARHLQLMDGDPTLDIKLPPRSSLSLRPLTDDEIALCRSHALRTLSETRQPAAWGLAETGARSSELPLIRVSHVQLDAVRVHIVGTTRTEPRWGFFTDWGFTQVQRRLRSLVGMPGDPPLIYAGRAGEVSAQASTCAAISSVLARAGLGQEPDVGPRSVAAWAGAEAHRRGLPIDEVARILGVRSLDRAARIIGWDWRGDGVGR
jgi:integrase